MKVSRVKTTTFLIPDLHCPSCVSHIDEALRRLSPVPTAEYSVVDHQVVVHRPDSLSIMTITQALNRAGYSVYDVIDDSVPGVEKQSTPKERPSLLNRFSTRKLHGNDSREERRAAHLENCDLCREAQHNDLSAAEATGQGQSFVQTGAPASQQEATLSISGMTCASCVGTITEQLKAKPWVKNVSVNLLTHSGTVLFEGDHANDIVETISDAGYDAVLEKVDTIKDAASEVSDEWEASYAIGGMTCSSCVGAITSALEEKDWVKKVDVNLISNSANIIFTGKDHIKDIESTIDDAGYDAKLSDLINAGEVPDTRRSAIIKVDGLYCEHCEGRISKALEHFDLSIDQLPTEDEPYLKISYTPQAPDFTIRSILEAVAYADDAFEPSLYHPPSLEERARQMRLHEKNMILYRVILSFIVAIPTFVIGIVYMSLVSHDDPGYKYLMKRKRGVSRAVWALFALSTPIYFFAADLFHRKAIKELWSLWRPGSPTPILRRFYRFGSMNMLMSFGTTIAYFASIAEMIISAKAGVESDSYFDSVVFLAMFLLLGRLIEAYSKAKTGDAVAALGKLRPKQALLVIRGVGDAEHISEDRVETVNVDLLEMGDVVRVQSGGSPPMDGIVIEGESKFDESSLTGESKPVSKAVGDTAFSGTINQGPAVSIRITGAAGASMLDQIIKVVREGQTRRAPVERVADIITGYFVPIVTLIAILTWLTWLTLGVSGTLPADYLDTVGGWPYWSLQFAIAVFVVACPCGIGLAAPTALFVGGGLAAQHGILVKGGGEAFQEASGLDIVVFDKTGTLTVGGEPTVTKYEYFGGPDKVTVLSIIKRAEEDSSHPIAKAAVSYAKQNGAKDIKAIKVDEIGGRGMKGTFRTGDKKDIEVLIGNELLMSDYKIDVKSAERKLTSWKKEGRSVVLVATKTEEWVLSAAFAISDPIRLESFEVVTTLQKRGVSVWMISGDNPVTAYAVGSKVGIPKENIIAGVLPDQKADKIKYLQSTQKKIKRSWGRKYEHSTQRATVAMVGDGINDSPALTIADVGIAIGSGSDVAISSAEFVLVSSSLLSVLTLIDLSRAVFRRIKMNFLWALIYNIVALPVAAGALYSIKSGGRHVRLDPVWASLAMALSSISVVCSSLLLRSKLPVVGFRAKN